MKQQHRSVKAVRIERRTEDVANYNHRSLRINSARRQTVYSTEHNRKAIRILEQLGGADTYRKDGNFVQRRWLVRYGGLMHALDREQLSPSC